MPSSQHIGAMTSRTRKILEALNRVLDTVQLITHVSCAELERLSDLGDIFLEISFDGGYRHGKEGKGREGKGREGKGRRTCWWESNIKLR